MSQPGVAADHFPSTHRTWLQTRLNAIDESIESPNNDAAARALDELRQHLMARYYEPLLAYARGSTLRTVEPPDELVHGFFSHAVAKPRFLAAWIARGGSLRRWMMNGLILHARGVARDRARERQRIGGDRGSALVESTSRESSAESAFESAWAFALLEQALRDAGDSFLQSGRSAEFDLFRRHVIDGRTYPQLHVELGIDPVRAASRVRAVMSCVRDALRERLREECEQGAVLDDEVRVVLRLIDGG